MQIEGNILKMRTENGNPVNYFLPVGEQELAMNELVGKEISMIFDGRINCIACGKQTKRSFNQGFCYKCLQTAPESSESIIRPELSKAHFGIARDLEWAEKNDLTEHTVYLAVSTVVKVGVTRCSQVPTRWIDQGANYAVKLAKTPNRHIAGVIEVFLKKHYTDRTSWKAMLTRVAPENIDILQEKQKVFELLPKGLQKYFDPDDEITYIEYPLQRYPLKVINTGFDKQPAIQGVLSGIKGQYLIFEDDNVLNIRKYSGYYLKLII